MHSRNNNGRNGHNFPDFNEIKTRSQSGGVSVNTSQISSNLHSKHSSIAIIGKDSSIITRHGFAKRGDKISLAQEPLKSSRALGIDSKSIKNRIHQQNVQNESMVQLFGTRKCLMQAQIHLKAKKSVMQGFLQPDLKPVSKPPQRSKSVQNLKEPKEMQFSSYFVSLPINF